MQMNRMRSAVRAVAVTASAIVVGPTIAAQKSMSEHCEDLASRFKTIDVSHMSPDKLESARRQAAHGARLCKSKPETGVKALDLAFRDIGVSPN
jgi:hypothetical protein